MATVSTDLMTAEQFYDWVHRPENADRFFELERGKVVEMPPPAKIHGFVCGNVSRILGIYGFQTGRGYVCTNGTGLIVHRNPDTVRGADVSFYADEQTFDTMDRKYTDKPPLLVAEVRSPSDTDTRIIRRSGAVSPHGVRLVWIINPEERMVAVYQPGEFPRTLDETDELTGNSVLPEFRCRVAEFFAVPGTRFTP